jgi:hypothetical protein
MIQAEVFEPVRFSLARPKIGRSLGAAIRKSLASNVGAGGGGFSPASLPNLVAWWDLSTQGTPDGTAISSVADGSGSGNTLVQGTGANQPLFKTGIQNGLGMGLFDGVDDYMTSGLTAAPTNVTILAIVRPITSFAASPAMLGGSIANGPFELRFDVDRPVAEALKSGTAGVGTATNADSLATATQVGFTYDSSGNFAFFRNGTANGAGTNLQTFAASTTLVGARSSGADFYPGYVGEMLICSSVLSTT